MAAGFYSKAGNMMPNLLDSRGKALAGKYAKVTLEIFQVIGLRKSFQIRSGLWA